MIAVEKSLFEGVKFRVGKVNVKSPKVKRAFIASEKRVVSLKRSAKVNWPKLSTEVISI